MELRILKELDIVTYCFNKVVSWVAKGYAGAFAQFISTCKVIEFCETLLRLGLSGNLDSDCSIYVQFL